jgi:hypothetical protein
MEVHLCDGLVISTLFLSAPIDRGSAVEKPALQRPFGPEQDIENSPKI